MNFRQVKKKIKTVKNVKKITNAMQMVSAVKMRKAQLAALEGREYRFILDAILNKVMKNTSELNEMNIPWLKPTEGTKTLTILVTSNKGLCGSFHSYLFKHVLNEVDASSTNFITIGQKGAQFVSALGSPVLADFSNQLPFVDNVSAVFTLIEEQYVTGEYKEVNIIFNKFISSLRSEATTEILLPLVDFKLLGNQNKDQNKDEMPVKELKSDYVIEPSVGELLGPLIQDYIKERIRSAIADSEAAEHSARMVAMKAATDNAGDVIYSLTLLGNKLRQSQITNELLDMVAAKESSEAH